MASAQTKSSKTISEIPSCEVCRLPKGYKITEKQARKCLKDEKTAKRVDDAIKRADVATAENNVTRGQLKESRLESAKKDKKADKAIKDNAVLQARVQELSRQRWTFGAVGAGGTVAVGLLILLLTR